MAGLYVYALTSEDRSLFLPGATTDGHHQIELACEACHTPFLGVRQEACLECHAAELEAAEDSHPDTKFADPRNIADLEKMDATLCVTCHVEHRPQLTNVMGVTQPVDFCHHCHADIAEERVSHEGLGPETCASAGCHNYHDNTALYEDFLTKHATTTAAGLSRILPPRDTHVLWSPAEVRALQAADADGPAGTDSQIIDQWAASVHAAGGVSCKQCHEADVRGWVDHPPREACADCHELEHQGFVAGRHGMRWPHGLSSMSPSMARVPMHEQAYEKTLDCGSCHDVHRVDVRYAAVEACLSCHADEHSLAYKESPHFELWQREVSGQGLPGSGVSCASCHLPREMHHIEDQQRIVVNHNQNANLRPNEKMIRNVCMQCHTLALSIDALADVRLIRQNFANRPDKHVQSIDMAKARKNERDER